MKVFKFGGASVKDKQGVENLGKIVKQYATPGDVVIVSAMGKSTAKLESMAFSLFDGQNVLNEIKEIKEFHLNVSEALEVSSESSKQVEVLLEHLEADLTNVNNRSRKQLSDKIMAYGELLSTTIVEGYLSKSLKTQWVDVRNHISTDDSFNEAKVDWLLTSNSVKQRFSDSSEILVTQGFLGKSFTGETTTLGKEGSDFTAAIIASSCDAESVTIWKDVPGILNADPKKMDDTVLFDQLSYQEAAEMTYYGAKVIHPKTIRPLAQKSIPLYVRSFVSFDKEGTVISEEELSHRRIPSYIFKFNQVLVSFKVRDLSFVDERRLSLIFHTLDSLKIKLNMIQNSAVTLSACFDLDEDKMELLREALKEEFEILYNDDLILATIKNYDKDSIERILSGKDVFLEQKTRFNFQVLYRS
ncbi:MAG: aspartate kinase [bacterium]|nr:aspartate kinase [bacterium]